MNIDKILSEYGERGVAALREATPKRTGLTSRSWTYRLEHKKGKTVLLFDNSNIQNGTPIAIIIQYGFVTKTGFRVPGRDYINPALTPIYEEIMRKFQQEVRA
jgi:hypothetical protein